MRSVYGFSVVDVGGNWLRVSKTGETEEAADGAESGLAKILEVAARLGDAHGEDAQALKALESGLSRYPTAPALDRARALLFRAEPAVRVGDHALAQSSLADAQGLPLADDDRAAIAGELAHAAELVAGIANQTLHHDDRDRILVSRDTTTLQSAPGGWAEED